MSTKSKRKHKRSYLIQKLNGQNEIYWFCSETFQDKKELFVSSTKIWKQNISFTFGPKILRSERKRFDSTKNFVSKTNMFVVFLDESMKAKAFDLGKKRWFDIAIKALLQTKCRSCRLYIFTVIFSRWFADIRLKGLSPVHRYLFRSLHQLDLFVFSFHYTIPNSCFMFRNWWETIV